MQLRKCAILIAALGLSTPVLAQSNISGSAASGANIGATSTNETGGTSRAGVQGQGSGSADLSTDRPGAYNRAMDQDRAIPRKSDRAVKGAAGANTHIGASGTNETGGNSRAGVKAQGSGSGNADMGANRGRMRERNATGNTDATVSGGTGSTRTPGASGSAGANAGTGVGVGVGGTGVGVDTHLGIGAGATTR